LDVDSRALNDEGHLMHKEIKWKTIRPLSAGIMSHHLYGARVQSLALWPC
jgi:hypothetical protein